MRKAGIIIAMAVWIVTAVRLINVNVRAGEDVVTAFNTIKYDNVDTIIAVSYTHLTLPTT